MITITKTLCILIFIISVWAWNDRKIFNGFMHFPFKEERDQSYYRLFTSIFLHGSWLHLLVNLFVLYSFGEAIEYQFIQLFGLTQGRIYFLILFLLSGILADIPTLKKFKDDIHFRSVGASGSISGIMFAYVLFYPWNLLYLYGIIPIPGIVAGIGYIWYSRYAAKKEGGRIDHNAHLFGAISGLVITILMYPAVLPAFFKQLMSGLT